MAQTPPDFHITTAQRAALSKSGARHKYDYGHAVVVSGPPGQGGAARLAATSALRIGAGLVSVFSSLDSRAEHAARLDAVMVKTHADGAFAAQLAALAPAAVCIGPNLGLDAASRDKVQATLALSCPTCLDADALTLLAQGDDLRLPHDQIVLTPHEGELRRLIPEAFETTTCRVTLAQHAAATCGATVLFKGEDTLVASPDGTCMVVKSAGFAHAAWLATAGSGDVLSGIVTGLLARGFSPFDAATLGATLHLQCAAAIGPGLIAEDIPAALPGVLAACIANASGGSDHPQ